MGHAKDDGVRSFIFLGPQNHGSILSQKDTLRKRAPFQQPLLKPSHVSASAISAVYWESTQETESSLFNLVLLAQSPYVKPVGLLETIP